MPCAARFGDEKIHLRPVAAHVRLQPRSAEIEETPVTAETLPLHPALDRGLCQRIENIRRQFEVAAGAVEFEHSVGRLRGKRCRQQQHRQQPKAPQAAGR